MEHKTSSTFINAKKATLAAPAKKKFSVENIPSKCSICLRLEVQETDLGYDHRIKMISVDRILCGCRCEAESLVCRQVRVGAGDVGIRAGVSYQSVKHLFVKWPCNFLRAYNLLV